MTREEAERVQVNLEQDARSNPAWKFSVIAIREVVPADTLNDGYVIRVDGVDRELRETAKKLVANVAEHTLGRNLVTPIAPSMEEVELSSFISPERAQFDSLSR